MGCACFGLFRMRVNISNELNSIIVHDTRVVLHLTTCVSIACAILNFVFINISCAVCATVWCRLQNESALLFVLLLSTLIFSIYLQKNERDTTTMSQQHARPQLSAFRSMSSAFERPLQAREYLWMFTIERVEFSPFPDEQLNLGGHRAKASLPF